MTVEDLNLLVDYNYWARDRVLEAAAALTPEQFTRDLGNSFASVRNTIAHICDAETIWSMRWNREHPTGFQPPERMPDIAAARAEWAESETRIRNLMQGLTQESANRIFEYNDFRGNPQADVFWQSLQHVVNHGSYHRGQLTTMIRQLGATPPKSMDLIANYREKRKTA